MTSNKASQATQSVKTTNVSEQGKITPYEGLCDACRSNNTLYQISSIKSLRESFVRKGVLCIKYKIRQESFDVLLAINERWLCGLASTVFSLSIRDDRGDITALHYKVDRLIVRNLVEVVGYGHKGCKSYAPTLLGLRVIDELFPV